MIDADMTEMDVVEIALTTAERLGQHALTWKRRLVEAEATIQRVRKWHAEHCDECNDTGPCPTIRAIEGDSDD